MNHVYFVRTDDWVSLYINNTLVDEGHSFPLESTIRFLNRYQPYKMHRLYLDIPQDDERIDTIDVSVPTLTELKQQLTPSELEMLEKEY